MFLAWLGRHILRMRNNGAGWHSGVSRDCLVTGITSEASLRWIRYDGRNYDSGGLVAILRRKLRQARAVVVNNRSRRNAMNERGVAECRVRQRAWKCRRPGGDDLLDRNMIALECPLDLHQVIVATVSDCVALR